MKAKLPALRFLRRAHSCSYCQEVHGVTFSIPRKVRPRLMWVRCKCGRSHYVCLACARRIGSVQNGDGKRYVAECARGYFRRNKKRIAAERGTKGGA